MSNFFEGFINVLWKIVLVASILSLPFLFSYREKLLSEMSDDDFRGLCLTRYKGESLQRVPVNCLKYFLNEK